MATAGVPLWSKTAATNATSDPTINWAEGQPPSSVNDSARAVMAAVAKWRDDLYGLTTAGSSTAYTVTTNSTFASAADMSGALFTIIPDETSGAAPTLAVDGLTARALNLATGVAVPTGALIAGTPYLIKYVHATTEFIVLGAVGKDFLASIDIIGGTQETAIAVDDTLPIYDLSATANRRMLVSDFLKVVNALTADSSPDRAADYVMTYDASATAAKKVLLQNLPSKLPRGYIDGCTLANGTDATNDINISAGACRDSTNAVDITVAAMSGKQLDANWAPGSAAGLRNSAAGITDTTYHIYAVAKADGTQDIYAHTSTTVATVITALQAESGGADYLYARRIGSIIRSGSAILGFTQNNDYFRLKTSVLNDNTSNGAVTAVSKAVTVPAGIVCESHIQISGVDATGSTTTILISPLSANDETPTSSLNNLVIDATGNTRTADIRVMTNASSQVRTRQVGTSSQAWNLRTWGWSDSREKDA